MNWIEAIGYSGTAFTIIAYGAKHLVPLRISAILSSLAFLTYGILTQSYPVIVMEIILLPVNSLRLLELLRKHGGATV